MSEYCPSENSEYNRGSAEQAEAEKGLRERMEQVHVSQAVLNRNVIEHVPELVRRFHQTWWNARSNPRDSCAGLIRCQRAESIRPREQ